MLKFEWDINKANAHQKKQGVTFEEASTVLSDVFSITVTDPKNLKALIANAVGAFLLPVV